MSISDIPNNTHPQWWRDPGMRKLNFLLFACYLGAMTNGYVSGLISSLIANPRWFEDISGLSDVKMLGLVVAAQPLGCIAGFFPAPSLSDTFGRRVAIILGNIGMIGGFTGQIFCKTAAQFLGLRLISGFASIFNTISSAALVLELAHPRQRGVVGALFNTFWFIGSMTAAWTSYGALSIPNSWSWRLPVAIQLVCTVTQLILIFFCPESPRWLVAHRKQEQAKAILAKFHANGRTDDQLVVSELSKICSSAEIDSSRQSVGWLALCNTRGNRKRLMLSVVIGVGTQCVGNGIISFYLAPVLQTVGITSSSQQQGINGGLQVYTWVVACGAALLTERVGRRRLFLTSASVMLVFMSMVAICSALYATSQSIATGYAVIVFLFLFFGGYVIGLTPIPILYVNEIWPSNIRVKGTSVFWLSQALATCFNQYVNPIALQRIVWKYYFVYVGVLLVFFIFMFFQVPETKGLSLEEVGDIFDRPHTETIALNVTGTHGNDLLDATQS